MTNKQHIQDKLDFFSSDVCIFNKKALSLRQNLVTLHLRTLHKLPISWQLTSQV